MPKVIVSIDGVVIKEVQLTKDRTTLGRRPYNDIVIDNLAVSGEHAVIQIAEGEAILEDLNSTNGTYINGKAIKKQPLQNNDSIEIGKYKIRFHSDQTGAGFDKTMVIKPGSAPGGGWFLKSQGPQGGAAPGGGACPPGPPRPPPHLRLGIPPPVELRRFACSVVPPPVAKWPWSRSSPRSASPALRWRPSPAGRLVLSWPMWTEQKAPP